MRIAQIAPLYESIPPNCYGGTERVVAFLVDALIDLGHEVTLFASGESKTRARLINCRSQAIWADRSKVGSENAAHLSLLDEVRKRADQFDIFHFHMDILPFPMFEEFAGRTVTTMHGRLDLEDLQEFYRRWSQFPLVSISDNQRVPLSSANWAGTVYHGLPLQLIQPPEQTPTADYLAFLGRICTEKRPHIAINLATRLGKKIRIAAKVQPPDVGYFEHYVQPLLDQPGVEYIGEIGDQEKINFLGNAEAMMFPIDWPEPFGMVLIEAMASGTPTIAWGCGSVPEIIEHGVTGYIVHNEDQAMEALQNVKKLDRTRIRAEFERRFSARQMATNYVEIYQRLLDSSAVSMCKLQAAELPGTGDSVESVEATMPRNLYAIKHNDSFAIANGLGDIIGKGDGFFHNDTRLLSQYHLSFGGKPLSLLSASLSQDDVYFKAQVTNRPLPQLGDRAIPEGIIHIERTRFLWNERLYESLHLTNFGQHDVEAPITIDFAADFKDIFEVRGKVRKARGEYLTPVVKEDHVILSYCGLDQMQRSSALIFSHQPESLTAAQACFIFNLLPRQTFEFNIEIGADYQERPSRTRFRKAAAKARKHARRRRHDGATARCSDRIFDSWLEKSRSDLALLTSELSTGPYPYAGIPWFSTPFGRDAVITAMQLLWLDPLIARGVLAFLASTQAQETSTFSDAEPGKIMHETRKGEMSQLGEVPFKLYYGGVDTTALFVTLAGAYVERTGDLEFINSIWHQLSAAMDWMRRNSEQSPDGFLSYQSAESTGLRNQGWKDSEDSVFHADGEFPVGRISLVEVQAYRFAALMTMSRLCRYRGESEASVRWLARAETLRESVEQRFWMQDRDFYALAIDGDNRVCKVRTSNAGHLLLMGLPQQQRADKITEQLMSTDFNSGWGIRTLATDEVRYNPMSYHNGSVWPHDTAICAAGMARYGNRKAAAQILDELFAAAVNFDMRLPELYCGFQHVPGEGPIAYPVACLPQSWSSGSGLMALQACLGLNVNGLRKEITIHQPEIPSGVNRIVINNLTVGESRINLVFQRTDGRVTVFTEGSCSKREQIKIIIRL